MSVVRVIDSHTCGEPTRLVLEGGPDLGSGPLSERLGRFREHFDHYRSAIVNEPRGSDTVVGALLCAPHRGDCRFGVIFFNNVGFLGMCGHGTIGLVASLALTGQVQPGLIKIDTPVGPVDAVLHADGQVTISLGFGERAQASLHTTLWAQTPTSAAVFGSTGRVEVARHFYRPTSFDVINERGDRWTWRPWLLSVQAAFSGQALQMAASAR